MAPRGASSKTRVVPKIAGRSPELQERSRTCRCRQVRTSLPRSRSAAAETGGPPAARAARHRLASATARARGVAAAPTRGQISAAGSTTSPCTACRNGSARRPPPARAFTSAGSTAPTPPTTYVGRMGSPPGRRRERVRRLAGAPAARSTARRCPRRSGDPAAHFQLAGKAPDERVAAFHDDVLDRRSRRRVGVRPGAARRAQGAPPVSDARHRDDDPGRAGRDHPAAAHRRRRDRGRTGHRQDRVALHRVAYLLYTHRERLARSGVLVVGPSAGFIRYVGGVLPALGDSGSCSPPRAGWRTASSRPPSTRTRWPHEGRARDA